MSELSSARTLSTSRRPANHAALPYQPEFAELRHLLADILVCQRQAEEIELLRMHDLANALNAKGFTDDQIRQTFADDLRKGRCYS